MKIIGIIAEYNPFHEGHAYQLRAARDVYGADAVIVVMSGDFVQRGAPAIVDKYARAELALRHGADVVLMLPTVFSVASAEHFTVAGVSVLEQCGCVDALLFGSENDDIDAFRAVARLLLDEPEPYRAVLQSELKNGASFPLARDRAIRAALPITSISETFLSSPNNILGLEYVKALLKRNSLITPIAMKRVGANYHDASIAVDNENGQFVSASAIRNVLYNVWRKDNNAEIFVNENSDAVQHTRIGENAGNIEKTISQQLGGVLSRDLLQPLVAAATENTLLFRDDFSLLLHNALIQTDDFSAFADCPKDLANRIRNEKNNFRNWTDLNDRLKTKELTYTRISRVLTNILLGITESDFEAAKNVTCAPYLRVLGITKGRGEECLSEIKRNASVPLITNPKNAAEQIEEIINKTCPPQLVAVAQNLIQTDLYAANLARAVRTEKSGQIFPNEFQRKFLAVPPF